MKVLFLQYDGDETAKGSVDVKMFCVRDSNERATRIQQVRLTDNLISSCSGLSGIRHRHANGLCSKAFSYFFLKFTYLFADYLFICWIFIYLLVIHLEYKITKGINRQLGLLKKVPLHYFILLYRMVFSPFSLLHAIKSKKKYVFT